MFDVWLVQVLPYLVRRAHENSDVLGRAGYERSMIAAVLKKRAKDFAADALTFFP